MLAVTIDLILVAAALSAAAVLWFNRRRIQPVTVWEKLMTGSGLLLFALVARLSDVAWTELPWPALAHPALRQALSFAGLAGGTLAVTAGVAEWLPIQLEVAARGRWRSGWSAAQSALERVVWQADTAKQMIDGLVETFVKLCATPDVTYYARSQRTGEFIAGSGAKADTTSDEQTALRKLASQPRALLMRTVSGWLLAVPVKLDRRIFGAILVRRAERHLAFTETALLEQTSALAALAMGALITRVRSLRRAACLATELALERRLGASTDPTTDLMGMLDVLRAQLDVEYACVLAYEGEGEYARRYSRLWEPHALSERGIQVAVGNATSPRLPGMGEAMVQTQQGTMLSPAALPHRDMVHHAGFRLTRGGKTLGLLVVAGRRKHLGFAARQVLQRSAGLFATAVERIGLRLELNQMSRRLSGLGRLAGFGTLEGRGFDYLTTRMLDEIPGTFCQYMRLSVDSELIVTYRRARRGNFGSDTTGRKLPLSSLPTCRMVVEAGRSMVFRQDDPERCFESGEAELLFGAEPNSILMVPVTNENRCVALLAVGEMREVRRHTFSVADRRFADSFSRLASVQGSADRTYEQLGSLGDLNLSFSSPLTGILGSVEILRQKITGNGPHVKYLDVIEKNASRIRAKVGELADLAAPFGPLT